MSLRVALSVERLVLPELSPPVQQDLVSRMLPNIAVLQTLAPLKKDLLHVSAEMSMVIGDRLHVNVGEGGMHAS